jgi:hypothetical protein
MRPSILIDGEATVEPDFAGLHPNLLRIQKGLEPLENPYVYAKGSKERSAVKLMSLILINFPAKQPVERYAAVYEDQAAAGSLTGREAYDLTVKAMADISDSFSTDAGVRLMYEDSKICDYVTALATAENIPVLPVHDSYICRESDLELVSQWMRNAAEGIGFEGLTIRT